MTSDNPAIQQRLRGGGLRKQEILRGYSVFRTVLRSGNRIDGEIVRCTYMRNLQLNAGWHFGFRVSSHFYNATQRNRTRRLFREAIAGQRRTWQSSNVNLSIILEPRRGILLRFRLVDIEEDIERICITLMDEFSDL